ncbi:MAG TPA: S41 family peptidase [Vicinamibacterales bacterium]|nr:S41 family peptidase [Vicinamibacterales bacterium]
MRRVLSSICFTAALLCPWIAYAQNGPSSCNTTSQNLWVRDQLNTYYYWYQFMPSGVNPASFNSPESYLEAVRYKPIDTTFSFITTAASNDAFYSDSQFIGYGFGNQTTPAEIRVLQVYDDSPASEAGLSRGDRIVSVNGRSVPAMIADGTIGGAFGAAEVGVATTIEWETQAGERRNARMVKRLVTIPTVSLTSVVDVDGRKVGYLFFRNFVQPSTAALTDAFAALKTAGATELVLDLRYNGGGLVDVAVHLASLIGGTRTNGQVMLNYVHNDKIGPILNKTTRFANLDESLNLQRLVVITTRSSASASELVINSLRPYIPVTTIGDTTYGKPVGQYGLRFCDKVLYPVAFSIKNANLEGDFFDGLAVDCAAGDDYTHQLGDSAEASFAEALTFIRTGACSPKAATESRALRVPPSTFRPTGWASILNAQ